METTACTYLVVVLECSRHKGVDAVVEAFTCTATQQPTRTIPVMAQIRFHFKLSNPLPFQTMCVYCRSVPAQMERSVPLGDTSASVGHDVAPTADQYAMSLSFSTGCLDHTHIHTQCLPSVIVIKRDAGWNQECQASLSSMCSTHLHMRGGDSSGPGEGEGGALT